MRPPNLRPAAEYRHRAGMQDACRRRPAAGRSAPRWAAEMAAMGRSCDEGRHAEESPRPMMRRCTLAVPSRRVSDAAVKAAALDAGVLRETPGAHASMATWQVEMAVFHREQSLAETSQGARRPASMMDSAFSTGAARPGAGWRHPRAPSARPGTCRWDDRRPPALRVAQWRPPAPAGDAHRPIPTEGARRLDPADGTARAHAGRAQIFCAARARP